MNTKFLRPCSSPAASRDFFIFVSIDKNILTPARAIFARTFAVFNPIDPRVLSRPEVFTVEVLSSLRLFPAHSLIHSCSLCRRPEIFPSVWVAGLPGAAIFPVFHRFPRGLRNSAIYPREISPVRVKIIFILSAGGRERSGSEAEPESGPASRWGEWWDADGDAHVRGREGERHKPFRTVHIAARCHRGNTFPRGSSEFVWTSTSWGGGGGGRAARSPAERPAVIRKPEGPAPVESRLVFSQLVTLSCTNDN